VDQLWPAHASVTLHCLSPSRHMRVEPGIQKVPGVERAGVPDTRCCVGRRYTATGYENADLCACAPASSVIPEAACWMRMF
jgi:hypothetical protein